jgi:hypothetical protein
MSRQKQKAFTPAQDSQDRTYGGLVLPAIEVLSQRLDLAHDMVRLALRDSAVLPTPVQGTLRTALKALVEVQTWVEGPHA